MNSRLPLYLALVLGGVWFSGCATRRDDARLQGTWVLNRYATAAATSNAPPETIERFKHMPENMVVNYSHGAEIVWGGKAWYGYQAVSFHYRVVEHGSNYVVIRTTAPVDKGRNIRIRFENGDIMYWIDTTPLELGIQERFDKLQPKPLPPGMGGLIAPPPIPLDW